MNRYTRTLALAVAAVAALPLGMLAATPANAADVTIRGGEAAGPGGPQGDVVENRNLGAGSWTFLREGVRQSAPGGADRSGVYWAPNTQDFPGSVSQDWTGSQAADGQSADNAVVIYIDVDGPGPIARDALLHEEIYGAGDLWLPESGSAEAKLASPGDSSGSSFAGPIGEWKANLERLYPDMTIVQVGSNLSGDGQGRSQGVLRTVTLGEDVYTFTSDEEVAPTPEPVARDVNGNSQVDRDSRGVSITLNSQAQPDNTVVGQKLRWRIAVDGFTEANIRQGFDEVDNFNRRFAARSGRHVIRVFKNGSQVRNIVVNAGR